MTEWIAANIEVMAAYAPVWGFFLIFFFMTVESSFIPFPSEVVMIPAGFLAFRGELTFGIPWLDFTMAVVAGLAGSMAGSYINYYLACWLGRPVLHRYGKYFFLPEKTLNRAEEIFRQYGDVTTFVCRLLPAIRQLISIPAGLARMSVGRFSLFTALGAGIWTLLLTFAGWYLGHLAGDVTYPELVAQGTALITEHYIWIILGAVILAAVFFGISHRIMKSPASVPAATSASE